MADKQTTDTEFDADIFDQMLYGSFEETADEPEEEETVEDEDTEGEDEADTAEDSEYDSEYQEDTDQEEESVDDEELDEDDDGYLDEDSEDTEDDEEEDSLVEDDDLDDESEEDTTDDEDDADEAEDSEEEDPTDGSEDDTDTEEVSDGDTSKTTDEIDYKAFYDAVVNTEFTVNGKKTKGFSDPKKIIQSQQMAGGFSEKMAGFKKYRPYMAPLKERGMLEDPAKFDLAMNLIDGDPEAIKKHLQSLDIDPIDLDMDEIKYSGKANTASQEALILEDVLERAKNAGIEDRVRNVIGNEWDNESFQEFVSNDAVRNDLLEHMESGMYDLVQDKMNEMSRLDYNGSYGNLSTVNKYRAAVGELQREASTQVVDTAPKATKPVKNITSVTAEKAKIARVRKEEAYKEKAAKREAALAKQRKKATSMSKKKPKAKPKAKFDPIEVEGQDLDNLMDYLIQGGKVG